MSRLTTVFCSVWLCGWSRVGRVNVSLTFAVDVKEVVATELLTAGVRYSLLCGGNRTIVMILNCI